MSTEKEKMLKGKLYCASDPKLIRERKHVRQMLHRLNVIDFENEEVYSEIME